VSLKSPHWSELNLVVETRVNHKIPELIVDSVGEKLPTIEEIEQYAKIGEIPACCKDQPSECAAKILLALTRKTYRPRKADRLWKDIKKHEKYMERRLGRPCGISVATLDYLINVSGKWDQAVVAEADQIENLTNAATVDGLTGLYMREVFDSWLEKMVAECQRYGDSLSLLMADIDDFKAINDTHGHPVGDKVLKSIGAELKNNLRSADFAARYGGEELAAVLPHTKIRPARTVAEKIRIAVEKHFADRLGVTISIGVASWHSDMRSPTGLIKAADQALYEAKQAGKNCVYVHGRLLPPKDD
jgi:diguanylate cyclase (GGDEF)-like protein